MSPPLRPLWDRLPWIHREQDLENEGLLDQLTAVFEAELAVLYRAPWSRYDDLFVETASPEALVALAARVGHVPPDPAHLLRRGAVANHLRWQRRRGTRAAVEGRARDVTGWNVQVVELLGGVGVEFDSRSVGTTLGRVFRPGPTLDPDTPAPRTVEIRSGPGTPLSGGVRDVGVIVHRVIPGPLEGASPGVVEAGSRYTLDPFGRDRQLVGPDGIGTELRYGPDKGVAVRVDGQLVPEVQLGDLSAWRVADDTVVVDPVLGRLAFGTPTAGEVRIDAWFGHVAALGCTPLRRGLSDPDAPAWIRRVVLGAGGDDLTCGSLADAVQAWIDAGRPSGLVRIADSATHAAPSLALGDGQLILEAEPGEQPHLVGDLVVSGTDPSAQLQLAGLALSGRVVAQGDLAIVAHHVALLGGLAADDVDLLEVDLTDAISGPIRLPGDRTLLRATRCILDGRGQVAVCGPDGPDGPAGPISELDRCTVLGDATVLELDAAVDCLFVGLVRATRGVRDVASCACRGGLSGRDCFEFGSGSHLPEGPRFVSLDPAHPAYGLLHHEADAVYRTGARSGSALGAFHDLLEPQRLALLREVLQDQVPVGLTAVIEFVP